MAYFRCGGDKNINHVKILSESEYTSLVGKNKDTLYLVTLGTGPIIYKIYLGDDELKNNDGSGYDFYIENFLNQMALGVTQNTSNIYTNGCVDTGIKLFDDLTKSWEIDFKAIKKDPSSNNSSAENVICGISDGGNAPNFEVYATHNGNDFYIYSMNQDHAINCSFGHDIKIIYDAVTNTVTCYQDDIITATFNVVFLQASAFNLVVGSYRENNHYLQGLIEYFGFKWLS